MGCWRRADAATPQRVNPRKKAEKPAGGLTALRLSQREIADFCPNDTDALREADKPFWRG
jgi:hypothetical protein